MKKTITAVILAVLICMVGMQAFAAEQTATVYVTICNGTPVLVQAETQVTDVDKDGKLSINDAMIIAHEEHCKGGFAYEATEYGLSMTKLWGIDNGGSYGYYLNDATPLSLSDEVRSGDRITAFLYTDTATWSDTYSFFDISSVDAEVGEELTLTLNAAGYDENWAPITKPVANAVITVDGEESAYVTDAEGKVTLTVEGDCVISAVSSEMTLVPPVCVVDVESVNDIDDASSGKINGNFAVYGGIVAVVAVIALIVVLVLRKNKK